MRRGRAAAQKEEWERVETWGWEGAKKKEEARKKEVERKKEEVRKEEEERAAEQVLGLAPSG